MLENLIQSDIAIIAIFTFIGFMAGVFATIQLDNWEQRKRNKHLASSLPPVTREEEELEKMWRVQ